MVPLPVNIHIPPPPPDGRPLEIPEGVRSRGPNFEGVWGWGYKKSNIFRGGPRINTVQRKPTKIAFAI